MKQLRHLVEYAHNRGIVIVPEVDMPAHTGSWRYAYPQYVVDCPVTASGAENSPSDVLALDPRALIEAYEYEVQLEEMTSARAKAGGEGEANPGSKDSASVPLPPHSLLTVIRVMLRELSGVFHTSPYIHIGGDEVNLKCWAEDKTVVSCCICRVVGWLIFVINCI